MAQNTFDPSQFTAQKAKPLPVILLLDTSDSMNFVTNPDEVRDTGRTGFRDGQRVRYVEGGIPRMSVLNACVRKMLNTFSKYERDATEILVSIITFGGDTRMVLPPTPASSVRFTDLLASGDTPLGQGLGIAKKLVEDKNQIPSRAYRPLVVLVSDGFPNDSWQTPLSDFIHDGRTAKCDRMALAISNEADRSMLAQFIEGTGREVFEADTADQIKSFFRFVTMSTVGRTKSKNPNEIPPDSSFKLMQDPQAENEDNGDEIFFW